MSYNPYKEIKRHYKEVRRYLEQIDYHLNLILSIYADYDEVSLGQYFLTIKEALASIEEIWRKSIMVINGSVKPEDMLVSTTEEMEGGDHGEEKENSISSCSTPKEDNDISELS